MPDFENIYRQYYQRIYNYTYGQLLRREAAEDVASDVFFAVWKNLGSFDPERGNISSWLFTIAHNVIENYRQKAYSRHEVSMEEPPENLAQGLKWAEGEEGTIENPIGHRAYRILKKLTEEERHFLSLRYGMCLTHEEIAALLGMSAPAVRQRYSRLLAKCRRIDEKQED